MKITDISVEVVSEPKAHAVRDAIQLLDRNGQTRVRIDTDEGVSGVSTTYFGRVASSPAVLAKIITEQLAPAIIGEDPALIRGIRQQLQTLTDYQGTAGLSSYGISAIDLALWDLLGKSLDVPVWKLLGAQRTTIPTYAMVGWLELDVAGLETVSAKAMEQGFRGVKMKVGGGPLSEDIQRIKAVRAVIGPDAPLMVDANQAFGYDEALRRGRAYEGLGCRWFEEPLPAADTDEPCPAGRQAGHPDRDRREQVRAGRLPGPDRSGRGGRRTAGSEACGWADRLPRDRTDGGWVRRAVRVARGWCTHPRAGRTPEHDLCGERTVAGGRPGRTGGRLLPAAARPRPVVVERLAGNCAYRNRQLAVNF